MTFFGLATFAVANTSRLLLERRWHATERLTDPMMGFLYGVASSAMLVGVWRQSRRQADCS